MKEYLKDKLGRATKKLKSTTTLTLKWCGAHNRLYKEFCVKCKNKEPMV